MKARDWGPGARHSEAGGSERLAPGAADFLLKNLIFPDETDTAVNALMTNASATARPALIVGPRMFPGSAPSVGKGGKRCQAPFSFP